MREHPEMPSRTLSLRSRFAAVLPEAQPLQLSINSNALEMVHNPESVKRESRALGFTALPHSLCCVRSRTLDKCDPSFPYSTTPRPS
jgi:hypothetical protein